jgi:hypothetical protein
VEEAELMVAEDVAVEQNEAEVDEAAEHLPTSMVRAARKTPIPLFLQLNQVHGIRLLPQKRHLGIQQRLLEEIAGVLLQPVRQRQLQQLLRR